MAEHSTKMKKGRIDLLFDHPFFASIILKMGCEPNNEKTKTITTNGKDVFYNTDFIESLHPDEVKCALGHEVLHVVMLHHTRRKDRDLEKWNMACDFAINPLLVEAGFKLPEGALQNPSYKGKSAEEIYSLIPQQMSDDLKKKKEQAQQKGGGGAGRFQKGKGNDWDFGGVEDAPSPSDPTKTATPQEMEQVEADTKMQVAQALQAAKMVGKAPANIQRMFEEMTEPQIPWKEVLSRFMTEMAKNDYNWGQPSKRYISQGIYLPTLKNPELGNVCVFVDTSGSIGKKELTEMVSEVMGICHEYTGNNDPEILVVYIDSEVAGHQRLTPDDIPGKVDPQGGGGTDFRPGFRWLDEQGEEPICVIYFTDGYCSSFPKEETVPTLWVLTEKNKSFRPPFGEVAVMKW